MAALNPLPTSPLQGGGATRRVAGGGSASVKLHLGGDCARCRRAMWSWLAPTLWEKGYAVSPRPLPAGYPIRLSALSSQVLAWAGIHIMGYTTARDCGRAPSHSLKLLWTASTFILVIVR